MDDRLRCNPISVPFELCGRIVEAVHQGAGMTALVEKVGRDAGLIRIDVHLAGPTQAVYLVYHRELRNVPRIKAVVAAMVAYGRSYG